MVHTFTTATLGNTGLKVTRGLAASYRPGKETI
jgi:hypothetical protein